MRDWQRARKKEDAEVQICLIDGAEVPVRSTDGSAGYDIKANEDMVIQPGINAIIKTGVKMSMPHGMYACIMSRSGICTNKYVRVAAGVNVIDEDYTGEVRVVLENYGKYPYTVRRGDRIAQMVFCDYKIVEFGKTDSLPETKRGKGGFGSTGR